MLYRVYAYIKFRTNNPVDFEYSWGYSSNWYYETEDFNEACEKAYELNQKQPNFCEAIYFVKREENYTDLT